MSEETHEDIETQDPKPAKGRRRRAAETAQTVELSLQELDAELSTHGPWTLARAASLFDGDKVQMTFRHANGKHAAVSVDPSESDKHPIDRFKDQLDELASSEAFRG